MVNNLQQGSVAHLFGRSVAHAFVTADAVNATILGARLQNVADERLVTADAIAHDVLATSLANLDWLVEVLERESLRMEIAVSRLGQVLLHDVVGWKMAIVA